MEPFRPFEKRGLVHLRFRPFWKYIDGIREFCGFFTRATFEDEALGHRMGLVIHELVENAIRYGSADERAELELMVHSDTQRLEISVVNSASEEQIAALQEVFKSFEGRAPQDIYLDAMKRAAGQSETVGGLGLPRVQFEGNVLLSLDVQPQRVCVTARGTP